MYSIRKTKIFRKSYRKLKSSGLKQSVFNDLKYIIRILSSGKSLSKIYYDHELVGDYLGYRECHIKGDLLLIYRIDKNILILILADIGSHSELF